LLVLAGIIFVSCAGARNERFASDDGCPHNAYKNAEGRCVKNIYALPATCPAGQVKDKSGACVKQCPRGMTNVKGTCVCPAGYDNVDGRCVMSPCRPGMIRLGGACVCPPGSRLNRAKTGCEKI
jgi:hypothetical protein